jgi:phosphoglycolate phosphatase
MRIVLFDIDGTILSMGGAAREAFGQALSEASGRAVDPRGLSFAGKTDLQIAREILTLNGIEGAALPPMIDETMRLYVKYFARDLPRSSGARLLPGMPALIDALRAREGVRVALLTGNVREGARLKLGYFGLADRFEYELSCFGDDHADRYQLPALALKRARASVGDAVRGDQLTIVGDSEHDVLCGRSIGARAVAVATGWTPGALLQSLRPDHFLADFSDPDAAIRAILGPDA